MTRLTQVATRSDGAIALALANGWYAVRTDTGSSPTTSYDRHDGWWKASEGEIDATATEVKLLGLALSNDGDQREARGARGPEVRAYGLGGQFAKGGGRVPGKAVTALAEGIAANAVAIEPEVTATVAGIVADAGGRMDGLAHRLKTPESMARKIDVKARERGITHEASAARISDAVRYTAVVGEARYSDSVHRTIADLESKGYKAVELETHWQRGDAYNGVHLIVQHPNGVKVEIQFHTEASIAAKGQTHKIYEKARLSTTTPEQRRQMTHEMIRIADTAAIPPGADSIGTMVFRPPSD